ncbi:cobalt ECF transporter T component CbiQ [Ancylobacter dichloromethanicus]|uniref:Cobalt ECF transporter T component CbiQ n=1 Tax=Ancylobacter dichloromethanicus TaxID=518825 RepID=A0A9W6J656_9HYPH|nr:cobalt ECF transporter T component CbiQ [Ancylobacter dichloromethanicus]GLK70039.1 cobalt ECF transporter T component CbiQ [Ancylobacter dichloromethanicus]
MTLPQDLRLRLVGAFLVIASLSQLRTLAVAGAALAAVMLFAAWSRPEPRLWRRLVHVEGFLLLLFATLPFTLPGRPLFTFGPLTASVEGVERAMLIAAKVSASVLLLMAMLGSVEPARLGSALRGLYVPETMVRVFVLTARYLALIRDEARRLHEAMVMRGFRPRSNRHTWRSYGHLVGMLLVRALARAQRVEEAMLCRGYEGRFPRLGQPAPAARDWAGFGVAVALSAAVTLADRL